MNQESLLDSVVVPSKFESTAAVIWLHGLGADGHDFEPIVANLNLDCDTIKFIFPHAPKRPITINGKMIMPAWYDISSPNLLQNEDAQGIIQSASQIDALIKAEVAHGIPTERIVLAGFSQGGAIAMHTALRYPKKLGGLMALSTYLPLPNRLNAEKSPINAHMPFYYGHGTFDPVVPYALAEISRSTLTSLGYSMEWHTYPMMHQVTPEQIQDISKWLNLVLG